MLIDFDEFIIVINTTKLMIQRNIYTKNTKIQRDENIIQKESKE